MNSIKTYDKYKDSGIAWLGEIPEDWKIQSFKNILIERNEKNDPIRSTEILSLSIGKGVTLYAEKTTNLDRFKDDFTKYKIAYAGDLVFNSMNMIVGAVGVSNYFGCVSPVYYTYRGGLKQSSATKFYEYLFRCKTVQGVLYSLGKGLIAIDRGEGKYNTMRLKVSRDDLRSLKLPYPNPIEQSTIVNFLNYKTSKIDRFILKKKHLIKALNERKASIVDQAVTKGLGTHGAFKDSKIESLGDIPAHWEIRKLKYLADCFPSNVDKHTTEGEREVRLCNYTDVYKNDFITNEMPLMIASATDDQIEKFTLVAGDVVITKDSETANDIAVPAFVKEDLDNVVCGYHLSVLRANSKLLGEYLFRLFQSKKINVQFELCSNGVTRVALGSYDLKNAKVPVPPIDEQQQIIEHLNRETKAIYKTIAQIEKEIVLTEEYRTALIAEAVTGKIDVRNYKIPEAIVASDGKDQHEQDVHMDDETEFETQESEE
jgi:type I restriction enzyme S subunit